MRKFFVIFLILCFSQRFFCETTDVDLARGLSAYHEQNWRGAVLYLKKAISSGAIDEDTQFLLIRSEVNAGEYEIALADCEDFLKKHDASVYRPIVMFIDGKLLCKQGNFERAVLVLSDFCHSYPDHELYAEALFWLGEAFYLDYDFSTALSLYLRVVDSYPNSAICRDCKIRVDEIKRREREEKLLYLLKVTGEENLSTREEYERQLKRYQAEDRIGVRKQLAAERSRADELEKQLAALRSSGATIEESAPLPEGFEKIEPKKQDSTENSEKNENSESNEEKKSEGLAGFTPVDDASSVSKDESESSNPKTTENVEELMNLERDELTDEEYENELETLRKKARRIQQVMEENAFEAK